MPADDPFQLDIDQIAQELKIRPEIYSRILTSFSWTLQQKMDALTQALSEQDMEKMRKILHEIKGTSGNLRLACISQRQQDLHTAVKDAEPQDKLAGCLEELKQETDRLSDFVKNLSAGQA